MLQPATARHPALVIGGMHRSGTSLVASLCRSAGLDVGDRLVPPHASNPAGHFEDLSFFEFHERVLAANGRIPAGYDILDAPLAISAQQQVEARSLVATRRQVAGPWGWKDPRTVLFLDFWREQMPEARFLFVVRSPWQVVNSLTRRGEERFRSDPRPALRLWHRYNALIRDFATAHPDLALVRELDSFITTPAEAFAAIRSHLRVPLAAPESLYRPEWLVADDARQPHAGAAGLEDACLDLHEQLRRLAQPGRATAATPRQPSVAVVIPVHRLPLTPDEEASLAQARHYLSIHDRIVVAPQSLAVGGIGLPVRRFEDRYFASVSSYSRLLLTPEFYAAFADREYILIHQLDSLVFSHDLARWCRKGWDYVGAPWLANFSGTADAAPWTVGNGGLSLRRIAAFRRILDRADVQAFLADYDRNEDLFWSFEARRFDPFFRIPEPLKALAFAMESNPRACFVRNGNALPFGCHYWNRVDRGFWETFLVEEARRHVSSTGPLGDARHPDHAWAYGHANRGLAALADATEPSEIVASVAFDLADEELDAPPTACGIEEAFQRVLCRPAPQAWLEFWLGRKDVALRQLYADLVQGDEFRARIARLAATCPRPRRA